MSSSWPSAARRKITIILEIVGLTRLTASPCCRCSGKSWLGLRLAEEPSEGGLQALLLSLDTFIRPQRQLAAQFTALLDASSLLGSACLDSPVRVQTAMS